MNKNYFETLANSIQEPNEVADNTSTKTDIACLTVKADINGKLFCDGNFMDLVEADKVKKMPIEVGQHLMTIVSERFEEITEDYVVNISEAEKNHLLLVKGLLEKEKRKKDNEPSFEKVEFIANTIPFVINTELYPAEDIIFEIKVDFGKDLNFWMGCYDFTEERKVARFFSLDGSLCYDYPDDWGGNGRTKCSWDSSIFQPHIIRFGNKFLSDCTSNIRESNSAVDYFATNAPFGLFGIIEFKGSRLPLEYNIPSDQVYKIFYFKAFKKGELVSEMIPVKDKKGLLCMYDLIRKQYYYPESVNARSDH